MDPELDFHDINKIKEVYERTTKDESGSPPSLCRRACVYCVFRIAPRMLLIRGKQYMRDYDTGYWEVPYLPIDPADVGREYEPIIRINSRSGKGGAAFILATDYGINMPKAMHTEFGAIVKHACDEKGKRAF